MSLTDWPPRANSSPPPGVLDWFQRELVAIAGLAHEKYPRLRLFWGQSMRERDMFPDAPGYDSGDILRHRYSLQEVCTGWVAGEQWYPPSVEPPENIPEGVIVQRQITERDIGIPRFFVHGWRSHTKDDAASWEADTSWFDSETGKTFRIGGPPVMPPGQWSVVLHTVVSNPEHGCCTVAKLRREKCFHGYREPGQEDLDYLAAMWREHMKQPVHFYEGEVAPPYVVEMRTRERLNQITDAKQRARAEMRLRFQGVMKDARHRLFDMPRSGYSVATGRMMPTGKNVR